MINFSIDDKIIEKIKTKQNLCIEGMTLLTQDTNNHIVVSNIDDNYYIETDNWDYFLSPEQARLLCLILNVMFSFQHACEGLL